MSSGSTRGPEVGTEMAHDVQADPPIKPTPAMAIEFQIFMVAWGEKKLNKALNCSRFRYRDDPRKNLTRSTVSRFTESG